MLWISYGRVSQEGIKGMVTNPSNRAEAVSKLIAAYGGKLINYYMLVNGDIDFIIVSDIPEDKIADVTLVNAMLVRASGAVETITTVPARLAEDAIQQMEQAKQMVAAMAYQAPTE